MELKCKIGIHVWDGCVCTNCGKTRDDYHIFTNNCDKCDKCGMSFKNQHDWSKDCETCAKCGKTRQEEHLWSKNCEICAKCGKTQVNKHQLVNGLCKVCGHGTFVDKTDGMSYKIVKIGPHVLMAENLVKKINEGKCWVYERDEKNLNYGYLYDWETAKSINIQGWHLPTKNEWDSLFSILGGEGKKVYEHTKSDGINGFNCLFGGWRSAHGSFSSQGASAHFWSSTPQDDDHSWHYKMSAYKGIAGIEACDKHMGLSIRLFRD